MIHFRPIASSSEGCAYLVECGTEKILIECGIPASRLRRRVKLSDLSFCLISHSHQDHCRATPDLLRAGVPCYMPGDWERKMADILGHKVIVHDEFRVAIGDWRMRFFRVVHDRENYGMIIGRDDDLLLYVTDCRYPPSRFSRLTHVCIEVNYSVKILSENVEAKQFNEELAERIQRNHTSLERALAWLSGLDLSRVREIWLLHLSDRNADEEVFRDAVRKATGKPVFVAGE